ncbi:hypothetical protein [Geothrix sp. 21YS21S-2]|uniref:hypothetical protein n=1 Tax=Geothrix sp. 21YS21S-2 TaxID=3068893 RepID=UPI0027B96A81|nr:hypothetical protein [Geothrix sp. 21YS21S-2]
MLDPQIQDSTSPIFSKAWYDQRLRRRTIFTFSLPIYLFGTLYITLTLISASGDCLEALTKPVDIFRLMFLALAIEVPCLLAAFIALSKKDDWFTRAWVLPSILFGTGWATTMATTVYLTLVFIERYLFNHFSKPIIQAEGFYPPSYESLPNSLTALSAQDFMVALAVSTAICLPISILAVHNLHRAVAPSHTVDPSPA